jgi:hypothetical protein
MLKKTSIVSLLILSTILFSGFSWSAEVPSIAGTAWAVGGKAKAAANFPGIATLKVTLPNVGLLGETFSFFGDDGSFSGIFQDDVIGMTGDWTQSGANFVINLDAWIEQIRLDILDVIGSGFVDIVVNDKVFSGKVGKGAIKGKFLVNFSVLVDVGEGSMVEAGTVILSGSLVGAPALGLSPLSRFPETTSIRRKAVASYIAEKLLFPLKNIK